MNRFLRPSCATLYSKVVWFPNTARISLGSHATELRYDPDGIVGDPMIQSHRQLHRIGRCGCIALLVLVSSCHNVSRGGASESGRIQVIPAPQSLVVERGDAFRLTDSTRILFEGGAEAELGPHSTAR